MLDDSLDYGPRKNHRYIITEVVESHHGDSLRGVLTPYFVLYDLSEGKEVSCGAIPLMGAISQGGAPTSDGGFFFFSRLLISLIIPGGSVRTLRQNLLLASLVDDFGWREDGSFQDFKKSPLKFNTHPAMGDGVIADLESSVSLIQDSSDRLGISPILFCGGCRLAASPDQMGIFGTKSFQRSTFNDLKLLIGPQESVGLLNKGAEFLPEYLDAMDYNLSEHIHLFTTAQAVFPTPSAPVESSEVVVHAEALQSSYYGVIDAPSAFVYYLTDSASEMYEAVQFYADLNWAALKNLVEDYGELPKDTPFAPLFIVTEVNDNRYHAEQLKNRIVLAGKDVSNLVRCSELTAELVPNIKVYQLQFKYVIPRLK